MKKMNNKGMAYLLIIILGGLLITGAGIYYASNVVESRISNNSKLSKEVFYFAESAINISISDILKNGSGEIIKDSTTINALGDLEPGSTIDLTPYDKDKLTANVTYKCISNNITLNVSGEFDYAEKEFQITSKGSYKRFGKNLLPRIIQLNAIVEFQRTTYQPGREGVNIPGEPGNITLGYSDIFGYGMSTSSRITFSGNTKITDGGAFSNGVLDLGKAKNQIRINRGEAYSGTSITGTGKIIPRVGYNATNPYQPTLTFPKIDFAGYRSIADQVFTGNQNFSRTNLISWQDTYPSPGGDGVIVIFVDGNLTISGNNKGSDDFINTRNTVIVVTGSVFLTGNVQIGSPDNGFAIIAGGDINKATGTADVYGIYYTMGKLDLKGTFALYGALASRNDINLSGTVDIHYRQNLTTGMPLIVNSTTTGGSSGITTNDTPPTPAGDWTGFRIVRIVEGSWREINIP